MLYKRAFENFWGIIILSNSKDKFDVGLTKVALSIGVYLLIIGSDERSINSSAARGYVQGSRADVILLGILNEDSKNNHQNYKTHHHYDLPLVF